jgi:DNA-binding XRE family transcriptional regulator
MPPRSVTFAAQLRALRHEAGDPTQEAIGRAISRTHSTIGLILRGKTTPPWNTAVAIIKVLGGDPGDFRAAWEDARDVPERVLRTPGVPIRIGLRELLVRHERQGDAIRAFLGSVTPDSLIPALPPGRLAEYRISGEGGRDVSVWHTSASGCAQSGTVHDGGEFLDWVLEHEKEAHADES